jgi:hypothetical protein
LYYARAYATTANGTTYGNQIQFTTLAQVGQSVTVTYKVNITNYLAGGATLDPTGIRIAGNFTTRGAAIPDWTPTAAAGAMTNEGNNIWSITVTYPDSAKGKKQLYKFVNGNWGTNENSDSVVAGGCGEGPDFNRFLIIPNTNQTYTYCWERCSSNCIVISASDPEAVNDAVAFPNPFGNKIRIEVPENQIGKAFRITNILGETVFSGKLEKQNLDWTTEKLPVGMYWFKTEGSSKVLRLIRN